MIEVAESAFEAATPALCRLQLGVELRQLRLQRKMTGAEVCRHLSWAGSKLTRLETADSGSVEPADVIALCHIYGAAPEKQRVLAGYATVTKTKKDWWQSPEVRDVIQPGFKAYLGLEATAEKMGCYEAEFVPGLLQTEPYVRAIHQRAHAGLPSDQIDRLVAVRMTRQEVLHRKVDPLDFVAIINEAVLRRVVADRSVMKGQLEHIMEISSSLPNVKVQVVPFSLGYHPGMNGPFILLRFGPPVPNLRPMVYLENLVGAGVSRRDDDVKKYETAFSELQALAPGYQESLSMIHRVSKEI
ncbi:MULTISPECIES: helix-turn-helix domain-containing protein [unclassified Streptomyces]|uniref:helix-turn-helix domain-containing protein n=1 Tax=unclassified Streptomyces TaxID=2593676 RepID=UPI000DAB9F19|nr:MULTISPECIES: helix-turn-helix transcriptional regulator [unclassified Streptomyces]PZT76777.1 XRE family transcriptional regulator [Streptomyces sp. AC1-42W]PZT79268.1 XRE family transcriptional regulator [Streptomyces sp. AC1-42T]